MADVSQPSPLTPALDRARALIASGDLDPAQVLLERAVELGRANLGEDAPDVLTAQRELAGVHLRIDDPMAARRVLEDAYAAGQWRLGDSDPVMLHISHDLGVVAQELGNRHEARKAFGRVAEHGPAVLGGGHQLVARARTYLSEDPSSAAVRPEQPSPRSPVDPPTPPPAPATPAVPPVQQPTRLAAAPVPPAVVPVQEPVVPAARQPVRPDEPVVRQPGSADRPAPVGHGPAGQGPVGQGPVGQGAVGQGAVGQGAVGQGPVGTVQPPLIVERARINPPPPTTDATNPAPALEAAERATPPAAREQVQAAPPAPEAPDAQPGDGGGRGQSIRPDVRTAMEQPTHVFPVARPAPEARTSGYVTLPPDEAARHHGPPGNPWNATPPTRAIPEQRQSSDRRPELPEQPQGTPSGWQGPASGLPPAPPGNAGIPPAQTENQPGYGMAQPRPEQGYAPAPRSYRQAQPPPQVEQAYGQGRQGQAEVQRRYPGDPGQAGYQAQDGFQGHAGQPGPLGHGAVHPGRGEVAPDRPAGQHGHPGVWQPPSGAHPGWQGPLPVEVAAGHPYPQEGRGRGLAVALTVIATLMAVIAVGALVVVLVEREGEGQAQQAPPVPQVTVSVTGPVLAGDPPTGVKLDDDGTVVTVTWSDPTDGKVPFVVMMAQDGQQLKPASNVGPEKTAARVTGLNPGLQYCFTVVAVYATDRFATSNQVCTKRN